MRREKDFDCEEMKREAQRKLEEKYAGIPEEQARRLQWEEVLADPVVLGPFLSRLLPPEKLRAPK